MLYTPEIYHLNLDADLVVISSCESGYGDVIAGEGIRAYSRGFLQAGANNLTYSLWKVSDTHTRDLMIRFYEELLGGQDYAEALRQAKLAMLEDEVSAIPAHWAAFVFVGI